MNLESGNLQLIMIAIFTVSVFQTAAYNMMPMADIVFRFLNTESDKLWKEMVVRIIMFVLIICTGNQFDRMTTILKLNSSIVMNCVQILLPNYMLIKLD